MTGLQAVLFDLYGTLISISRETNPYLRLFGDLNLETPEEFRNARRIALTEDFENLAQLVKRIKPEANLNLESYEQEVTAEMASVVRYPETQEILTELRKRNFKLGLISNLATPYTGPFFRLGLDEFFSTVVFSCQAGWAKPDLRIYQKALRELGVEPWQALMIGDKVHCDVDPPKALGMKALLIDRKKAYNGVHQKITSLEMLLPYLE